MSNSRSKDLADTLIYLATRLPRVLRASEQERILTPPEVSALAILKFGGAMGLGELAAFEQITSASMSRTISLLKDKGFVTKERRNDDARGALIAITPLGAATFDEAHQRRMQPLLDWVEALDEADLFKLEQASSVLKRAAMLEK